MVRQEKEQPPGRESAGGCMRVSQSNDQFSLRRKPSRPNSPEPRSTMAEGRARER